MVELSPTHEVREGVDVVWQIPPKPKAILYLAHSSNGSPFSYWMPHPNVPQCTGTPEHKVVVKQALERGFAVIAGKSVTNEWETWPASTIDIQKCVKILNAWRSEHELEDLPFSAWGTSCGGDFVSSLATVVKMHALVVMISKAHPKALESAVVGEYPATLFVPMVKDEGTFAGVKENIKILKDKKIPCAIVEALPLEVHPHFFAEHIDELDKEQSAKLHSVFVDYGIVAEDNSLNGVLLQHDVELYLRKAGILPTEDDAQKERDEEKLMEAKKLRLEGRSKQPGPGGRGPGGHRHAGRRHAGPPHDGPPHEGPPHDGPPHAGPPHKGPPHGGSLHGDGVGGGGPPHGGPPHSGPPHRDGAGGGSPHGGGPPHRDGAGVGGPHGRGPPHWGPPHDGPPHDGPPHAGPPHRSPPHGGSPHGHGVGGGPHGGPPHSGPPHRDGTGGGGPHGGPPHEGSPHGGPPHDGPHGGPPHGDGVGGGGPGGGGPPLGGRGRGGRGPPPGGRGHGPKLGGGPPPSHPLARGVSNQLMVALGNHTLTARCNKEVFDWLEGKGWANFESL